MTARERILHDCAVSAALAMCDTAFGVRDEKSRNIVREVYPFIRAAIETYVEATNALDSVVDEDLGGDFIGPRLAKL